MKLLLAFLVTMTTTTIAPTNATITCLRMWQSFVQQWQRLWLPRLRVDNNSNNNKATTNSASATTLLACVGEIIVISALVFPSFLLVSTFLAALVDFDTSVFLSFCLPAFCFLFFFLWFLLLVAAATTMSATAEGAATTMRAWQLLDNRSTSTPNTVCGRRCYWLVVPLFLLPTVAPPDPGCWLVGWLVASQLLVLFPC